MYTLSGVDRWWRREGREGFGVEGGGGGGGGYIFAPRPPSGLIRACMQLAKHPQRPLITHLLHFHNEPRHYNDGTQAAQTLKFVFLTFKGKNKQPRGAS